MPASSFSALRSLRIGCVRYLNARPLIEPYLDTLPQDAIPNVHFDHPAALAHQLAGGELDIALVPVFEALRSPESPIIDGVTISATGPVWSVFVAYQEESVEAIRHITLDPASLTSANLCRLLFAERQKTPPTFHPAGTGPKDAARLLIGNQAIDFRETEGARWKYLDLAEEWQRLHLGLPFVFAVWLMRPSLPKARCIADAFRAIAAQGLEQVHTIASRHAAPYAPGFALEYLTEHIRFTMGPREKEAMALFRSLLIQHHQLPLPTGDAPLVFV